MEGGNVEIEYRWLARDADQALAFALELIACKPDILVVNSSAYVRAVRRSAGAIPVVFVAIADPVGQQFVASLSRPAGTMTGFGVEEASMGGKWLQLLKEIAPTTVRGTAIFNPQMAPSSRMFISPMAVAGQSLRVEVSAVPVVADADVERVIAAQKPGEGLIVLPDSYLYARRQMIVASAAHHRVPAIYYHGAFAQAGGLIAFGIERVDIFRRAANYVDRILKGAKPADLPVQMPVKFELMINRKTASALGLTVPGTLLARADEVIE